MATINSDVVVLNKVTMRKEDVQAIVMNDSWAKTNDEIMSYEVHPASTTMLGFLADYWKLTVIVSDTTDTNERILLSYFIKAVPRTNPAKAKMVKELKVYDKELYFYTSTKRAMDLPGLKPWSAKLITNLEDALVFQDLNALNYKLRNKFDGFDMAHTLQSLTTLARFHASTIVYEERKTKELNRPFSLKEEFKDIYRISGYNDTDSWFIQCKEGALEVVKTFSKFKDTHMMSKIENQWSYIWSNALSVSEHSLHRKVVCHRDLWNNNLLFHYNNDSQPDDCMLVDFQAVGYQPPAGDVMLLLCCNLQQKFREANLKTFLNFYYQELNNVLNNFDICLNDIIPINVFIESAQEQRLWGLIACACLMPVTWLDEDLTTNIFSDTAQFDEILSKDKGTFIKKIMQVNQEYREKVIEIFEEIVERYLL